MIRNVFILSTGRSGTVSFIKACEDIKNFTSSHESLWGRTGEDRFDYPDFHIEADNRLTWHLGTLDKRYGDDPLYVYLVRDSEKVAKSFSQRNWYFGIAPAYARALMKKPMTDLDSATDMVRDINDNIELFLKDKTKVINIDIEEPEEGFKEMWGSLNAKGDMQAAIESFKRPHNVAAKFSNSHNYWSRFKSAIKYFKYYIRSV